VRVVPKISQETLAEMAGTTRSRVNFFMNKFQRLGFIDCKDGLKVNNSLLTVVLHESQCHPSLKFGMQQDILETFVDRGQLRTLAQPTVYRAA
jgi:Crp-like helix-turn-helix protein